jgi:zinc/manganese transport system substrate-binding protein
MRLLAALPLLFATPALAAEVNVVASFSILGDMVHRIGGDRVAVTSIVGPDSDTHVYDPRPADVAALAGADLFVVNGLGFEGWLDRLVGATGYEGPVLTASSAIAPREAGEEDEHEHEAHDDHHDEHDHDEHDAHDHGVFDPHAWQDVSNGVLYVTAIAAGLCEIDTAGCAGYEANAEAYAAELTALDADIRERIAGLPAARRTVITSHDAFGYFGAAYGVRFLAPEGINTDAEPSAAAVAALIRQIRAAGVTAVFVENMSDGRLVQQIADETGAVPGGSLYADALSGPDGPAPTYLDMMAHNADLLIAAMGEPQ